MPNFKKIMNCSVYFFTGLVNNFFRIREEDPLLEQSGNEEKQFEHEEEA